MVSVKTMFTQPLKYTTPQIQNGDDSITEKHMIQLNAESTLLRSNLI